jgi:hypothetical protein
LTPNRRFNRSKTQNFYAINRRKDEKVTTMGLAAAGELPAAVTILIAIHNNSAGGNSLLEALTR